MGSASESWTALPRIGRYELYAEIASGGMGRVYLARARGPAGFEKLVALKTVHPELASEKAFVDMFFDEARIAARIDHPNVCRVFDFGEADGRYFLAMEYLVGETLLRVRRKLSGQPEPAHDALIARIIAEAAEGLHAAHTLTDEYGQPLDIVHRDVTPQNLFVTYDGGVRVVDFGIASAQGRLHRTATGSLKGKFAYMAPEQMRRGEIVDRRADVWGLGVVLWEMLTASRLYHGASEVDVILTVLNDPVCPPSAVRPSIDPELERIVLKALDKDRETRWQSARELGTALQRWIVSRGETVGMAEIGAFMGRLFETERAAAMDLVDRSRRDASVHPKPMLPASTSGVQSLVSALPVFTEEPVVAPPEAPQRGIGWIAAVGALATVAALGLGVWAAAASRPRGDAQITTARLPIEPPFGAASHDEPRPASPAGAVPSTSGPATAVSTAADAPRPGDEGPSPTGTTTIAVARPVTEEPEAEVAPPGGASARSDVAPGEPTRAVGGDRAREGAAARAAASERQQSTARARTATAATDEPDETDEDPSQRAATRRGRELAPAVTEGTVHVSTPGGWAEVYVDGRRVGRTPLDLRLPAGRVSVELRPFGLAPLAGDTSMRRSVVIGATPARVVVPIDT